MCIHKITLHTNDEVLTEVYIKYCFFHLKQHRLPGQPSESSPAGLRFLFFNYSKQKCKMHTVYRWIVEDGIIMSQASSFRCDGRPSLHTAQV